MLKAQNQSDKVNYEFLYSLATGDEITVAAVTTDVGITAETIILNAAGMPTSWISGGVDGNSYNVKCIAHFASGQVLASEFTLEIRVCR